MSESRGGESRSSGSSYISYGSESRGSESRISSSASSTPKRTSTAGINRNKIVNPSANARRKPDIGTMRAEIMGELYQEFYAEIKDEVRQELQDSKGEIVREVAEELKTKLKSDLKRNLLEGRDSGERE